MKAHRACWAVGLLAAGILGCEDPVPVPKPRGYFRIEMPTRELRRVETQCGPAFELPQYAGSVPAKGRQAEGFCGFDLVFPSFNAVMHCTHVRLDAADAQLDALTADAHEMAFNHEMKATGIGRRQFAFPEAGVYGLMYQLDGPVATPLQFYATDSVAHFLRGSLYFQHVPNPDSLSPALAQVQGDVVQLLETLNWP